MSRVATQTWLAIVAVGAALLSGCDVDVTTTGPTKGMPEKEVEQRISDALTKQVGKRPNSVDCPRGLNAKVGETMRCVLTSDAARLGVTVTVDAVKNGQIGFDIEVDEKPLPSSSGQ